MKRLDVTDWALPRMLLVSRLTGVERVSAFRRNICETCGDQFLHFEDQ